MEEILQADHQHFTVVFDIQFPDDVLYLHPVGSRIFVVNR
jgi:hypothetical protein